MKLTKVNKFKNRAMPSPNGYTYPTYKTTGDNSFIFGLIGGVRNAGKSNTTLLLLENEKDIMLSGNAKTYFISPTIDDKVRTFADKYPEHFEIVEELTRPNLQKVLDDIKERVDEWEEMNGLIEILERFLKGEAVTDIEMEMLEMNGYLEGHDIEGHDSSHPPISTIIIDDSASSPLLSQPQSKEGKWFIKFAIKHRHYPYHTNLIILSQHLKLISKILRVQCNLVVIFPFRDCNIYHNVFQEYSTLFSNKINNFLDLMKLIEDRENHSHATIYYDKKRFVRINWNEDVNFDEPKTDEKQEKREK